MLAPLRLCMGFEKYTSNPVFMTNLVCIVVFAIAFPSYFAVISGEDGDSGASATSTPGDWFVGFNETQETFSERINMEDGEQYVSSFMGNPDTSVEIAWIEATFRCNDDDDSLDGPYRDSIEVESDTSMVSGEQQEQSDQTDCGGNNGGPITMRWDVVANYSGEEYLAVQESMDDIRAQWDDGDEHRGEWQAIIDMDVAAEPIVGQDSDEGVEVTWTITYFVVEFEAFSDIME
jgi:hypothetical protein